MDAKSVWPGFDYAHTQYPSRGVEYYAHASRVKAIITFDKVLPGNTKVTTFVKVIRLTDEGEPRTRKVWDEATSQYETVEYIDEVRARELFMRWDEYEDETESRNQQKAAEQLERERLQAEREKERQELQRLRDIEHAQRERILRDKVDNVRKGLERIGLKDNALDTYAQKITMTYDEFLAWISTLEKVDCEQCHRSLVKIPLL